MSKIFLTISFITLFLLNGFSQQLKVSYSSNALDAPFTGKVIAYLSKENKEPKDEAVGIISFPCFSVFAKDIHPGQSIIIGDNALSYPTTLSNIERGTYYVQIVWDKNQGGRSIANSPGNLFNSTTKIEITKDTKRLYTIVASQSIPPISKFKETQFIREIKAPSLLLTKFSGKTMTLDAAVVLPKEYYTEPDRKFPVIYNVFGYGGDYHKVSGYQGEIPSFLDSVPTILVLLDGNCALGHSVYANSDNNGPWGDALVNEFIPFLEKEYRCNGARLLTGHSSGGWTVLWLQTQYPKTFAGCWSSSPDPVDFHSFQKVNLYDDKNIFYAQDSTLRLTATVAGRIPWATMKTVYQMEHVIYRGEQMQSFNAVFSKKGADGLPQNICNSLTGEINPEVFTNWKKYDISSNLKTNWDALKSDLDGKVRVSVGTADNFLLNHAVTLLENQMKELNSSFKFAYYPGDHFTVSTPVYNTDGYEFLKERYSDWLKDPKYNLNNNSK